MFRNRFRLQSRSVACATFALLLSGSPKPARILVLYGITAGIPSQQVAATALREELAVALDERAEVLTEFVDHDPRVSPGRATQADSTARSAFRSYIARKYAREHFDVIVAVGRRAITFLALHGDSIFPATPIVFTAASLDQAAVLSSNPMATGVVDSLDLPGTVELALALQPETERLFVVTGASEIDRPYLTKAQQQLPAFAGRLQIAYLAALPLAQLEHTVSTLPPRSVVLYVTQFADSAGGHYVSADVALRMATVANAPVYTWLENLNGLGVVGGSMLSLDKSMRRGARLVARVLHGEKPANIPVSESRSNVATVDWRELRRWNIDERLVPSGTVVAFRRRTFWDQYGSYIAGAVGFMMLQAGIIGALLVQRSSRHRAEAKSRALLDGLRESNGQIRELAGRLVTAQETERSRIGRELHDDVIQRISGLSIALSALRRRLPASGEFQTDIVVLQKRMAGLVSDVRDLSHSLHSGVLQHLGLAAALEELCTNFSQERGIDVSVEAPEAVDAVGEETSLCLYRVAQEALRNVATHSEARQAQVTLSMERGEVALSIVDDGHGFDPNAVRGARGLGLISLDERVRALDGTLTVQARPGIGTELRVRLPIRQLTTPMHASSGSATWACSEDRRIAARQT